MLFLKFLLVQVLKEFRHLSGGKCAIELAIPLQILFIQSLVSGIIPECLKRAAIVPIYKSGDKSLPSDYRPISLTPIS